MGKIKLSKQGMSLVGPVKPQHEPSSLYGLDISLLKQLNLDSMIPTQTLSEPKEEEVDFETLRKKFTLDNSKAASKLRGRCQEYAANVDSD